MKIIRVRPIAMMIRMVFMFDLLFDLEVQPGNPPRIEDNLLSIT